jgi:folate-binding protein YgfZ
MSKQAWVQRARQAGATVQERDGQPMIAHYGDAAAEYAALLTGAALFDSSSYGRLQLTGADRMPFLHNFTTQDIIGMAPDTCRWAVVSNWKGTIVDLVEVVADAEALTVITEPANRDKTRLWLEKYIITEDVTIAVLDETTALFDLIGPQAAASLASLGVTVPDAGRVATAEVAGTIVTLWCHRWIGGNGFRLLVAAEAAAAVWAALQDSGARPVGETALAWRRIADGYPAYGHELAEDINPWEARLDGTISLDKGCYLGQEVVARLRTYQKVKQYVVGLAVPADLNPAVGNEVHDAAGQPVGRITSVATPPHGDPLVLAMVKTAHAQGGSDVYLQGQAVSVVDRPFWQG